VSFPFTGEKALDLLAPSSALAPRAIGYADVRSGIQPSQPDRRCAASGMTNKIKIAS
jgi:hypothetical protein